MTLAQKLQSYRTQNGLTQEQVAEHLGISRQAVAKWEGGKSAPSTENMLALAKLYGVSLDHLMADNTAAYPGIKEGDNTILQANLTRIAIVAQAAWLNVAMQPDNFLPVSRLWVMEQGVKLIPLMLASVWMAANQRYIKDINQRKKCSIIELVYCLVMGAIAVVGRVSSYTLPATVALIAVAIIYILYINPKYMGRQLVKSKKGQK